MENEKIETQTNEIQNKKPNKKGKGVIVVLVIIILALVGCLAYVLLNNKTTSTSANSNVTDNNVQEEKKGLFSNIFKKKDEDKKEENKVDLSSNTVVKSDTTIYTYKKENGVIIFYKDGSEVSRYTCSGAFCYVKPFENASRYVEGVGNVSDYDKIKGDKVLIGDGSIGSDTYFSEPGVVVLYNIVNGVEKKFTNVSYYAMNVGFASKYANMATIGYSDDTYEIISYDGSISRKFGKDDLVFQCYEGCWIDYYTYDYEEDRLVFKKDGKYGIQKISDGTVVLNNEYEDIKFLGYSIVPKNEISEEKTDYFMAKKDGKYNLYNIKTMKQVTTGGYDDIWMLSNDIMLVYKDKYIYVKNIDETNVIEDKIYVEGIHPSHPKNPSGIMISTNEEGVINMYIETEQVSSVPGHGVFVGYTYNMKTKTLTKIES